MVRVATLVHNKKIRNPYRQQELHRSVSFNQNLTIKESFLTEPKLKVTVTSNFLMSPISNQFPLALLFRKSN